MVLKNDVEIEIHKTWYNKTVLQPDGITQIVDTSKQYTVYQFGMGKNYFDCNTKEEVIDEIIQDLHSTIAELTKMREKLNNREPEEERE